MLMFRRLADAWGEIQEPLKTGAIVIIEESASRIRRLPVGKNS